MEKGRENAISEALKQIEKTIGKGAIMKLGEKGVHVFKDIIHTGSLSLDAALGIGGVPRGRVVEIFGQEASGKTTLALHMLAEAQKQGGVGAFIDAEHALDPFYAKNIGVDTDNLLISQPDTGEEALEIAEILTRSGAVDIIVVDSVAALVPKAEIDGEMGESHMGLQARLMSQALRKLTGVVSKSRVCIVFINQVRYKIGIMFGNPLTTPGGLALKFHSSMRLSIQGVKAIKKGEEKIGNHITVRIIKNKFAPPFRDASLDILYGKGISRRGELVDLGVKHNILEKSGAWISYKGKKLAIGRENTIDFLAQNPDIADELQEEIKKTIGLSTD